MPMLTEPVLVLFAQRFNFPGENGRQIQGVKVRGLTGKHIDEPDRKGMQLVKYSGDIEAYSAFKTLPAYYKLSLEIVAGKNDVPEARLVGAEYVGPATTAPGAVPAVK